MIAASGTGTRLVAAADETLVVVAQTGTGLGEKQKSICVQRQVLFQTNHQGRGW